MYEEEIRKILYAASDLEEATRKLVEFVDKIIEERIELYTYED